MRTPLDRDHYRDVTGLLFPESRRDVADTALEILHACLGTWTTQPALLAGCPVDQYRPSGLVLRLADGTVELALVPATLGDEVVAKWRSSIEAGLVSAGELHFTRPILCWAPVEHRWELPRAGVTLFPVPEGAPRAPQLMAEHPGLLRMRIEGCAHKLANAQRGSVRAEWCDLILNAVTMTGCHGALVGPRAWVWDRVGSGRSVWAERAYFCSELLDEALVARTLDAAPLGEPVADRDYYLAPGASLGRALVLPCSTDETIAAADGLPKDKKAVLRRAARWIKAGDRAGDESQSLNYLALSCGLEALASDWSPGDIGPARAFRNLLADMLPYPEMEAAAARLYKLRSSLAHGGRVFPEDLIHVPLGTERQELGLLMALSQACRLTVANWIRARAGLPLIDGRDAQRVAP